MKLPKGTNKTTWLTVFFQCPNNFTLFFVFYNETNQLHSALQCILGTSTLTVNYSHIFYKIG